MAYTQGQNKIILYLIIILGFIAGYYYNSTFNNPEAIPLPASILQKKKGADELAPFRNLKIDFGILDNSRYKKLQVFGQQPVEPGQAGKRDIFAP